MRTRFLIHIKMSVDYSTSISNGEHPYTISAGVENCSWLMRATPRLGVPMTHIQLSLGKSCNKVTALFLTPKLLFLHSFTYQHYAVCQPCWYICTSWCFVPCIPAEPIPFSVTDTYTCIEFYFFFFEKKKHMVSRHMHMYTHISTSTSASTLAGISSSTSLYNLCISFLYIIYFYIYI